SLFMWSGSLRSWPRMPGICCPRFHTGLWRAAPPLGAVSPVYDVALWAFFALTLKPDTGPPRRRRQRPNPAQVTGPTRRTGLLNGINFDAASRNVRTVSTDGHAT